MGSLSRQASPCNGSLQQTCAQCFISSLVGTKYSGYSLSCLTSYKLIATIAAFNCKSGKFSILICFTPKLHYYVYKRPFRQQNARSLARLISRQNHFRKNRMHPTLSSEASRPLDSLVLVDANPFIISGDACCVMLLSYCLESCNGRATFRGGVAKSLISARFKTASIVSMTRVTLSLRWRCCA